MTAIEIGRLLRSGTTRCVVGCRVTQLDAPAFGGMVSILLPDGMRVYGLIHDIHIDEDGLVRHLVTAEGVPETVLLDNRHNRNIPVEIGVLFVGYEENESIWHLLPPRPPLTLDTIFTCSDVELCRFTAAGQFGYFRHVLRAADLPTGELLAAHLKQAHRAQCEAYNHQWGSQATQELIVLLRDDYPTLMSVLGALSDANLALE